MNVKLVAVILILLSTAVIAATSAVNVAAANCPSGADTEEDFRHVLRKALIDYLTDPAESQLELDQVKDLLEFYLTTGTWDTADCNVAGSNSGTKISVIVNQANNKIDDDIVPKCDDGTEYGECSTPLPKFCYAGTIVDKCSICGCPAGEACYNEVCVNDTILPVIHNVSIKLTVGMYVAFNVTVNITDNLAVDPDSVIAYVNGGTSAVIDSFALQKTASNTYHGYWDSTGFNESYYYILVEACDLSGNCAEKPGGVGAAAPKCSSDNTPYGQCSSTLPKYCLNGNLIDRCSVCGCPVGKTCVNETCVTTSDNTPPSIQNVSTYVVFIPDVYTNVTETYINVTATVTDSSAIEPDSVIVYVRTNANVTLDSFALQATGGHMYQGYWSPAGFNETQYYLFVTACDIYSNCIEKADGIVNIIP